MCESEGGKRRKLCVFLVLHRNKVVRVSEGRERKSVAASSVA